MTIELSLLLTLLGAVGSNVFTLWKHGQTFRREREAFLDKYAASKIEYNGYIRDINHTKNDIAQIRENLKVLDDENETRFRELERRLNELSGSFDIMRMMIDRRRSDD